MFVPLQEMEKLKEELENMNDLMEQKDTLTQKLEVNFSSLCIMQYLAKLFTLVGTFSPFVQ